MHTQEQMLEIMKTARHVCEFTNEGPCADWPKPVVRGGPQYGLQVHELEDGSLNIE